MEALADLLDDDNDTSKAVNILLGLYKNEALRLGIFTRLKLKLYREAEAAAGRLVAVNRTAFDGKGGK